MVYTENGTYTAARRRAPDHCTRSPPEAMTLPNRGVLSAAPCRCWCLVGQLLPTILGYKTYQKIQAQHHFETLVPFYQTVRRHVSEDCGPRLDNDCRDKFESQRRPHACMYTERPLGGYWVGVTRHSPRSRHSTLKKTTTVAFQTYRTTHNALS